jgi:acyl-CoA reductase-like NAD-dependent aldehyde dehydrogenase
VSAEPERLVDWAQRAELVRPLVRSFIEGQHGVVSGEQLAKFSPRDGSFMYAVPLARSDEVNQAIGSSRRAFRDGRWSGLSIQRRKEVLYALADLIEAKVEELALLECMDVGKPIREAYRFDAPIAARNLQFTVESADKHYSKVLGTDRTSVSYEVVRPLGVVAGVIGWNFPLHLAIQKLGPALVTGNTLVLKPSEVTSLSALRLAELAIEAGLPPGVLNVIPGDSGSGKLLAHHPDVDLLTFTGSSQTGMDLLVAAGRSNMKRLLLECGGKAPNIVFEDCGDLDTVADSVVASAFWNQGQVCVASSRLLIQKSIKDKFLQAIIRRMASLVSGDPFNPDTTFGPLVSRAHAEKVLSYVHEAEKTGLELVYRGECAPPFPGGFYVPPVIFDGVKAEHKIAREEIFGPLLSVMAFEDAAEAIELANGTVYGLSAVVWTQSLSRAHLMTQSIDAGWIVVNATDKPSGGLGEGVMAVGGHKRSGVGVEGGVEGLNAYLRKSAVQWHV